MIFGEHLHWQFPCSFQIPPLSSPCFCFESRHPAPCPGGHQPRGRRALCTAGAQSTSERLAARAAVPTGGRSVWKTNDTPQDREITTSHVREVFDSSSRHHIRKISDFFILFHPYSMDMSYVGWLERKLPRGTNRESETYRESETKNQKLKAANQKLKTANQKLKSRESETKLPRIRNQNPPNQKPKTANQKPEPENQKLCWSATMLNTILPSTSLHKKSNPPPPLATMLSRILPSTSLQRKWNPPPPLATMLTRILPSTSLQKKSNPPPSSGTLCWIGY